MAGDPLGRVVVYWHVFHLLGDVVPIILALILLAPRALSPSSREDRLEVGYRLATAAALSEMTQIRVPARITASTIALASAR